MFALENKIRNQQQLFTQHVFSISLPFIGGMFTLCSPPFWLVRFARQHSKSNYVRRQSRSSTCGAQQRALLSLINATLYDVIINLCHLLFSTGIVSELLKILSILRGSHDERKSNRKGTTKFWEPCKKAKH